MANTLKAAAVITKMSRLAGTLIDLNEEIQATMNRYTHNGGQTFIAPFFLDEAGQPRTDLAVTEAQIIALAGKLTQLKNWLDTNIVILVQSEQ